MVSGTAMVSLVLALSSGQAQGGHVPKFHPQNWTPMVTLICLYNQLRDKLGFCRYQERCSLLSSFAEQGILGLLGATDGGGLPQIRGGIEPVRKERRGDWRNKGRLSQNSLAKPLGEGAMWTQGIARPDAMDPGWEGERGTCASHCGSLWASHLCWEHPESRSEATQNVVLGGSAPQDPGSCSACRCPDPTPTCCSCILWRPPSSGDCVLTEHRSLGV